MKALDRIVSRVLGERVPPPPDLPAALLASRVVLRRGRFIPWVGGVLGRMGAPAAAVTLGRTIVLNPEVPLSLPLLAHEMTHVRQWSEDPFFPVRYTLATLRHGYRNNPFEVEAREAALSMREHSSAEVQRD